MSDAMNVLVANPDLTDACGVEPSWFCEGAWRLFDNRLFARATDWIITRPAAALCVIVIAVFVNRWLRRLVTAVVTRVARGDRLRAAALERLGGRPQPDPRDSRDEVRAATLSAVARAWVSAAIGVVSVLIVLGLFDLDLAPLLASAGIAGVAIGLGAQSLVRDCIAGFFMLLEDQCGVGDEVDLGAATGIVESVTLRTTVVRSSDGTLWSVPNGAITRVGNKSRNWAQGTLDVTVAHGTDTAEAGRLISEAAIRVCSADPTAAQVLAAPSLLGVEDLGLHGPSIRLIVRTVPGSQAPVLRAIRAEVAHDLQAAGISLASA